MGQLPSHVIVSRALESAIEQRVRPDCVHDRCLKEIRGLHISLRGAGECLAVLVSGGDHFQLPTLIFVPSLVPSSTPTLLRALRTFGFAWLPSPSFVSPANLDSLRKLSTCIVSSAARFTYALEADSTHLIRSIPRRCLPF